MPKLERITLFINRIKIWSLYQSCQENQRKLRKLPCQESIRVLLHGCRIQTTEISSSNLLRINLKLDKKLVDKSAEFYGLKSTSNYQNIYYIFLTKSILFWEWHPKHAMEALQRVACYNWQTCYFVCRRKGVRIAPSRTLSLYAPTCRTRKGPVLVRTYPNNKNKVQLSSAILAGLSRSWKLAKTILDRI